MSGVVESKEPVRQSGRWYHPTEPRQLPGMYTIFCVFSGDNHPFPIKINKTRTVFDLQKAIKHEQPDLTNVLPRKIELCHIDVKGVDEAKQISQDLRDFKRLEVFQELSTVFKRRGPGKGLIHILIHIAPRELRDPRSCRL